MTLVSVTETEVGMSTASDIKWTLDGPSWPQARPVIDVTLEALPIVADDLTADLITELVVTVADLQEELSGVRAVNSAALVQVHAQHREIVRLRQRVAFLLDDRRAERAGAS